jgi:hypothetical protein
VVAAGERFRCDYCRGWNYLQGTIGREELVCPTTTSASRVRESVLRHLQQRGLSCLSLQLEERVSLPLWQLVSQQGEELLLPAALLDETAISGMQAPALELVSRDDPRAAGGAISASATLQISREQAEATALASFQEPDSTLETVRLIWLSLVPVRLTFRNGIVHRGFYLDGADRVLLGSLPDSAADESLRVELAVGLAGFFLLCLVLGSLCRDWGLRIVALLTCSAVGWLMFRSFFPAWVKEKRS